MRNVIGHGINEFEFNANMEKINLKQIFLWGQEEGELINKYREFGALPKEGDIKCSLCGIIHLWHDQKENEWFWLCKNTYIGHARKSKNPITKSQSRQCRFLKELI